MQCNQRGPFKGSNGSDAHAHSAVNGVMHRWRQRTRAVAKLSKTFLPLKTIASDDTSWWQLKDTCKRRGADDRKDGIWIEATTDGQA